MSPSDFTKTVQFAGYVGQPHYDAVDKKQYEVLKICLKKVKKNKVLVAYRREVPKTWMPHGALNSPPKEDIISFQEVLQLR